MVVALNKLTIPGVSEPITYNTMYKMYKTHNHMLIVLFFPVGYSTVAINYVVEPQPKKQVM